MSIWGRSSSQIKKSATVCKLRKKSSAVGKLKKMLQFAIEEKKKQDCLKLKKKKKKPCA